MRNRIFIILLFILCAACDTSKKRIEQIFPGPGFEKGWSWKGMPKTVKPEQLENSFQKESRIFTDRGLKEMAYVTYFWGSPKDTSFTVNIFNMGSEENSQAVFQKIAGINQATADSTQFELPGKMVLIREPYVVILKSGNDSEKVRDGMRVIAKEVLERIDEQTDGGNQTVP